MSEDYQNHEFDAAIRAAVDKDTPGGLINKWVLVAEVIDGEGEHGFWTLASENLAGWDKYGMLMYAAQGQAPMPTYVAEAD